MGITFPLVADFPTFEAAKAFGVFNEERLANTRATFLIDKQGVIRHVVADTQSTEQHATESLDALKTLTAAA